MAIDDMESFEYHLQRLPEYTMNAKFMASPSVSETNATQQQPQQTVPNTGVPMPNQQPQQQANTNKTPCGVPLPSQGTAGMSPMSGSQPLPQAQPQYQSPGPMFQQPGPGFVPQQQPSPGPGFVPQQQPSPGPMFQQQNPGFVPQQQPFTGQQQYVGPQSGMVNAPPGWRGFI